MDEQCDGKDMALIDKFPQIKVPNKFFRNTGQLKFADEVSAISGNDIGTYSNGAVYMPTLITTAILMSLSTILRILYCYTKTSIAISTGTAFLN